MIRYKRLTKKEERKLIEIYTTGQMITRKILNEHFPGRSRLSIYKHASRLGLPNRKERKASKESIEKAKSLREQGLSYAQIAEKLGGTGSRWGLILRKYGFRLREQYKMTDQQKQDEIVALREQGFTYPQIEAKTGIKKQTARSIYEKNKIVYNEKAFLYKDLHKARRLQREGLTIEQIAKQVKQDPLRVKLALKGLLKIK